MPERTPEQSREYANTKRKAFFGNVPPALIADVQSLPRRIAVMNARTSVKLQEVLHTADRVFARAAGFVACARGCCHCCYQGVPITHYEAEFIGERLGIAPRVLRQSTRRAPNSFSDKTPCPFLENGECSVYEFRPLTCRTHVTFDRDNYWCRPENWAKPGATVHKAEIHGLTAAYRELAGKTLPIFGDIRDFFPNGRAS